MLPLFCLYLLKPFEGVVCWMHHAMSHAMYHAMSGDVWRYGTQGLDCSEDQGTWDYVKYLDEVSATASGYLRISGEAYTW